MTTESGAPVPDDTTQLDDTQQTALSAVRAMPGSTAAELAPLIRIGQREGVSRGRALGVLADLEGMGLVVRETGQRRVLWRPAPPPEADAFLDDPSSGTRRERPEPHELRG